MKYIIWSGGKVTKKAEVKYTTAGSKVVGNLAILKISYYGNTSQPKFNYHQYDADLRFEEHLALDYSIMVSSFRFGKIRQ